MKQIHIKLSEVLHRELKIQAILKGLTIQDYVLEAIKNQLTLDKTDTSTLKETNSDSISK